MKCPLPTMIMTVDSFPPELWRNDCLKEECAWWEKEANCCAALLIPKHLYTLERMLGMILEKIPGGGSDGK